MAVTDRGLRSRDYIESAEERGEKLVGVARAGGGVAGLCTLLCSFCITGLHLESTEQSKPQYKDVKNKVLETNRKEKENNFKQSKLEIFSQSS